MTIEQFEHASRAFKSIVVKKGIITSYEEWHRQLLAWDKNDSHKEKIIHQINKIKAAKEDYQNSLRGYSYEDWKSILAKARLYANNIKINQAKLDKLILTI